MSQKNYLERTKNKWLNNKIFVWLFIILPSICGFIATVRFAIWPMLKSDLDRLVYFINPPYFSNSDNNFKVLILPFERTKDDKTETFEASLYRRFIEVKNQGIGISVIYDEKCNFPSSYEDAKKIGANRNADMVLFGLFYNEDKSPHYSSDMKWVLTKHIENYFGDSSAVTKDFINFKEISEGIITKEQEYVVNWVFGLKKYLGNDMNGAKIEFEKLFNEFNIIAENDVGLYFYISDCYYRLHNYIKSDEYYSKIIQKWPNNYRAYHNYSLMKYRLGDYAKAKDLLDKLMSLASSIDPNTLGLYANILKSHFYKDYKNSQIFYLKSIELNPNISLVHRSYGMLLSDLNQYDSARYHLLRSIELDSNLYTSYIEYSILLFKQKNMDSSKFYSLRAIEINYCAFTIYNLAYLHHLDGYIDSAIQYYNRTIELDSNYAKGYGGLGVIFREMNNIRTSLKYCFKAISIDTTLAFVYFNIALDYNQLHMLDSSKIYYDIAVRQDSIFRREDFKKMLK